MNKTDKNLGKFKIKLRFKGYAESTINTYSYFLGLFFDFTDKPLSHITKKDAYVFLDECSELNHGQKTQIISALKLFYKFILDMILESTKTERPRKIKRLPRVIDWSELELKLKRISNLKHRSILELACRCALRVSEVCNIKLSDIDTERMMILIRDSKGRKDRYVPVSEKLISLLFLYCENYDPIEYLFNGQFSNRYSIPSCQKIFKKYIDVSKSFHTLRHSGATQMLNKGTDIRVIRDILGHQSTRTTEIYTHVSNELLTKAAL